MLYMTTYQPTGTTKGGYNDRNEINESDCGSLSGGNEG